MKKETKKVKTLLKAAEMNMREALSLMALNEDFSSYDVKSAAKILISLHHLVFPFFVATPRRRTRKNLKCNKSSRPARRCSN